MLEDFKFSVANERFMCDEYRNIGTPMTEYQKEL